MEVTAENVNVAIKKKVVTITGYTHPDFPDTPITFKIEIDEDKLKEDLHSHPKPIHPHTRDIPTARREVTATVQIGEEHD